MSFALGHSKEGEACWHSSHCEGKLICDFDNNPNANYTIDEYNNTKKCRPRLKPVYRTPAQLKQLCKDKNIPPFYEYPRPGKTRMSLKNDHALRHCLRQKRRPLEDDLPDEDDDQLNDEDNNPQHSASPQQRSAPRSAPPPQRPAPRSAPPPPLPAPRSAPPPPLPAPRSAPPPTRPASSPARNSQLPDVLPPPSTLPKIHTQAKMPKNVRERYNYLIDTYKMAHGQAMIRAYHGYVPKPTVTTPTRHFRRPPPKRKQTVPNDPKQNENQPSTSAVVEDRQSNKPIGTTVKLLIIPSVKENSRDPRLEFDYEDAFINTHAMIVINEYEDEKNGAINQGYLGYMLDDTRDGKKRGKKMLTSNSLVQQEKESRVVANDDIKLYFGTTKLINGKIPQNVIEIVKKNVPKILE